MCWLGGARLRWQESKHRACCRQVPPPQGMLGPSLQEPLQPPCSMQVEGYMVASNGQVADIAAAITAFEAEDLQGGYIT